MQHSLQNYYDFAVIGAGPAGLIAALNIIKEARGRSIDLIDKKLPWKEPVPCAEAVHRIKLSELVPKLESDWIRQVIDGVTFVSPDGCRVQFTKKGSGLIINRALMHKQLADECVKGGAHCNFSTRVLNISKFENGVRRVNYEGPDSGTFKARVIIDASGPGKDLTGEDQLVRSNFDLEPAMFALVKGLQYPPEYIQLYFGRHYAPGGYAWLFPRDENTANVGIVMGRSEPKSLSLRKAFTNFLEGTFPGAEIISTHGGVIACGHSPLPLASENLFKAGDAAAMVNPISRSGITEAMLGGKLAAKSALKVAELESESDKLSFYTSYGKQWNAEYGNNHKRLTRAKPAFARISDSSLNRAARRLQSVTPDKMTMGKIFLATMLANPLLLWQMRGLITK